MKKGEKNCPLDPVRPHDAVRALDAVRPLDAVSALGPEQLETVVGGKLGVYKPGFRYKKESLAYFRQCVGEDTYQLAMNSDAGRAHHYAVARAFLGQADWEKFVWIEEFGSLDGFPEQ